MTTATIKLYIPGYADSMRTAATTTWKVVQHLRSRARQRRRLTELTTDQLYDVGITSEGARAEAAKPFWRA
jgi:uncharacterized protein YjiS (DUF1127 family)